MRLVVILFGIFFVPAFVITYQFYLIKTNETGESIDFECKNGLAVKVRFEKEVRDFYFVENFQITEGFSSIHGNIEITNISDVSQKISTQSLYIKLEGAEAVRGHKKSIASEFIDFAGVNIEPGENIEFGIYWPINLKLGTIVDKADPYCKID